MKASLYNVETFFETQVWFLHHTTISPSTYPHIIVTFKAQNRVQYRKPEVAPVHAINEHRRVEYNSTHS